MLNTDLITMLMTFTNTHQQIIFNTSRKSLTELAEFIDKNEYTINEVKEYDRAKGRFKKVAKSYVRVWCDHVTEMDQIFEKQCF